MPLQQGQVVLDNGSTVIVARHGDHYILEATVVAKAFIVQQALARQEVAQGENRQTRLPLQLSRGKASVAHIEKAHWSFLVPCRASMSTIDSEGLLLCEGRLVSRTCPSASKCRLSYRVKH